jgi:phage terminase large subunit
LPTEFSWNYLASRLRTTDPEITPYMRCTANPGGVGAHWVKKRYISPAPPNDSFLGADGITRKFIPARLQDNPYLAYDGRYEQMLKSLPPAQRKQLLEGDWDVAEGAAFTEFERPLHVIAPFEIPIHWERIKGIDYGYASESCCIWGAVDPSDGTLIIYRELYRKGLLGTELAQLLTEMEISDPMSVRGVLDTACWSRTGTTGPTIGETLVRAGHKLRPADKNRIAGKIQIHEYLKLQNSGRPRIQIFNTCPNLIRELQSIPLDKNNPEDVDTHASDHAYDALRYLVMARPRVNDPLSQLRSLHREQLYRPVDSTFGY